jgi:CheY-like chemotaxis protein
MTSEVQDATGRIDMTELSQRKKVMIVDDSEIVLTVAQHALENAGYEVLTHPRPAGCIALILQEAPDLLLIDVNMPGLNGDTVVKMLGSTQANSQMVILLFSSLPADVLEQKAIASRAHGYIRKTESPMDLVRQVSRWIRPSAGSGAYLCGAKVVLTSEGSDSRLRIAAGEAARAREGSNSQLRLAAVTTASSKASGRILLVDHEMIALSELRRLVMSHPGPVEFALSGTEVLRRLQGNSPPDVVVLGTLVSPPNSDDLLREAARLNPRWQERFIIVHDSATEPPIHALGTARLRRPITEASLCDAIQDCLQFAS